MKYVQKGASATKIRTKVHTSLLVGTIQDVSTATSVYFVVEKGTMYAEVTGSVGLDGAEYYLECIPSSNFWANLGIGTWQAFYTLGGMDYECDVHDFTVLKNASDGQPQLTEVNLKTKRPWEQS